MIFRQLFEMDTCTYTYLLGCEKTKQAIIIDPVDHKVTQYAELIDQLGLKLIATFDTHVHADHITGSGLLKQKLSCQYIMGKGKSTTANCVDQLLTDGETFTFGDHILTAYSTPGHTDDSYCYRVGDLLFTGDTLLIRGSGRTDFQNGSATDQYHSIFEKLLKLSDTVKVYPGHDYNGRTMSTIYEERHFNPRLQVNSKEAYVEQMNNLNLPNPKYMDVAVPANLKCGLKHT